MVELQHNVLLLGVRPGTDVNRKREVLAAWYREGIRQEAAPLATKWEPVMGVKVEKLFVQGMSTKWGSCNPGTGAVRLNTESRRNARMPRVRPGPRDGPSSGAYARPKVRGYHGPPHAQLAVLS